MISGNVSLADRTPFHTARRVWHVAAPFRCPTVCVLAGRVVFDC